MAGVVEAGIPDAGGSKRLPLVVVGPRVGWTSGRLGEDPAAFLPELGGSPALQVLRFAVRAQQLDERVRKADPRRPARDFTST